MNPNAEPYHFLELLLSSGVQRGLAIQTIDGDNVPQFRSGRLMKDLLSLITGRHKRILVDCGGLCNPSSIATANRTSRRSRCLPHHLRPG